MRVPRPLETLRFLLAWLVPWRPAFRTRASKSGLNFFVHWRGLPGRRIAKYGVYEPALTQWISEYLSTSSPGIFIDIGANLGWHAIHAAQRASVETIVAFEPDAFNVWLLERNLTLNGVDKVIINACAVGAHRGIIRLNRYKNSNLGRHSVLTDYGYGSRMVPITDLDTCLEGLHLSDRRVLILKIDVEGYEPAVIMGAKKTLKQTDIVITEHSPDLCRAGGLSLSDMVNDLQAAGYRPHRLLCNGHVIEVSIDLLRSLEHNIDVMRSLELEPNIIWVRTTS